MRAQQGSEAIVNAEFVAAAKSVSALPPPTLFEVAFAGRSNAGKSTLMNAILRRRSLVRTSRTPGATRQVAWFRAVAGDGLELFLVDLPGYGYAQRSQAERRSWGALVETYLFERPTLVVVTLVFDARRSIAEEERTLVSELERPARVSRRPLLILPVATKIDRVARSERKPLLLRHERELGRRVIPFSSREPDTALAVWREIRGAIAGAR